MNKRGVALLQKALIALVIGGLVMVIVIVQASEQGKEERYLINFYSKDIALLLETMQAVPGDVQLNYPLEPGYVVWLGQGELSVYHPEISQEAYVKFPLLQNIFIEEQEASGLLIFTKKNNKIALDARSIEIDACNEPILEGNYSVELGHNRPSSSASLTEEELELLQASIQRKLDREGIESQGPRMLYLTLGAGNEGQGNLWIQRKRGADDAVEAHYESLYCIMAEELRSLPLIIEERIEEEQSSYLELELIIDPTDIGKEQFMRERAFFSEGIIRTIRHVRVEE